MLLYLIGRKRDEISHQELHKITSHRYDSKKVASMVGWTFEKDVRLPHAKKGSVLQSGCKGDHLTHGTVVQTGIKVDRAE